MQQQVRQARSASLADMRDGDRRSHPPLRSEPGPRLLTVTYEALVLIREASSPRSSAGRAIT
jgi:hypothetical protein